MFTEGNFDELSKLWDGCASNAKKVCGSCGACCHNIPKTLFPGEYEYAKKLTGQMNSEWKSVGCLCHETGYAYKPIICRIFPLDFKVTLGGVTINWDTELTSEDSDNCKDLHFDLKTRALAEQYMNYLFADLHMRVFYILTFNVPEAYANERKHLDNLNTTVKSREIQERATYSAFGFSVKEYFPYFD